MGELASNGDFQQSTIMNERAYARRLLSDSIHSIGSRYLLIIVVTAVLGLATLLPAQFFRYFTESSQTLSTLTAKNFISLFLGFGLLVAASLLISSVLTSLIHERLRLQVEASLREKVMRRLHDTPLSHIDDSQRGDWLTRVTGDLSRAEMFLTDSIPGQIREVVLIIGISILFFIESGWLAFLPLVSALFIGATHFWVQIRLSPILSELRGLHAGIFQMLIESFEGIRTIRSQRAEPFVLRRFQNGLSEITLKSMRVVRYLGALIGGTEFIGQILVTLCLTAAAWSLTRSEITLQQALTYPFFIGLFYAAVQRLASSAYEWNRFFIEAGRLGAFLFQNSGRVDSALVSEAAEQFILTSISVGYATATTGPIDLSIKRGECLAVIGPSGIGKSTFLEVLAGLRPPLSGTAALIDKDGVELWRKEGTSQLPIGACAYVEQRPYIFEGSLRENLTLGNPTRQSDVVLWNLLTPVGLGAFTQRRGGLDSTLLDRGRNLSEGERYRIALCRALLLCRPFLLLDEPFASLDTVSMEGVVSVLDSQRAVAGIVVVTHFLPRSLVFDAVIDFTQYQVQRRGTSLSRPEISTSNREGKTLIFRSPGKTPAISNNHQERKVIYD